MRFALRNDVKITRGGARAVVVRSDDRIDLRDSPTNRVVPMRFRIPPFLPPYAVLVLVITYAVGALWLGSARLDGITQLTEAAARNAETANDLNALVAAINDMETAGRGFVITGDESFFEQFERGRRRAPVLLSSLRDKMRDDTTELSLIEELVSLISERSTIIVAGIERRRSAPDQPPDLTFRRRARETSDGIRKIVATLEAREQDELRQIRETLTRTLDAARRGLYVMAGVTLLLVVSLFLAVRRLRTFISVAPDRRRQGRDRNCAGSRVRTRGTRASARCCATPCCACGLPPHPKPPTPASESTCARSSRPWSRPWPRTQALTSAIRRRPGREPSSRRWRCWDGPTPSRSDWRSRPRSIKPSRCRMDRRRS